MTKYFIKIQLFILIISLFSCSNYNKLLKSNDSELKLSKANEYYKKEKYDKAFPLLEELYTTYKGTSKGEEVYFNYAYCQYYLDDYFLASYHFRNFAKTYGSSEKAEEAFFMGSYCIYLNSPNFSLDQTYTYKAIEELQLFINYYPKSSRVDSCNVLIDKLRNKLETKSYKLSILYYNIEDYKAALIALNNVIKDFPDTKYKEEIMYYMVKSSHLLAKNSIKEKKEERIKATQKECVKFAKLYSNSKYLKEVNSILEEANKDLEKLQSINI